MTAHRQFRDRGDAPHRRCYRHEASTSAVQHAASGGPAASRRRSRHAPDRGSRALLVVGCAALGRLHARRRQRRPQQARSPPDVDRGARSPRARQLYETACITCHGANLQGVHGPRAEPDRRRLRRPSTSRSAPAACRWPGQEAQAERKTPLVRPPDADRRQLGAYIQALGGGPAVPRRRPAGPRRRRSPAAASCSGSTARPATASPAAAARCPPASTRPDLDEATDRQIYAAMLTGPQNMPMFGDNQLTPDEKRDIIAYIQNAQGNDTDPGGYGSAGIGPVLRGPGRLPGRASAR